MLIRRTGPISRENLAQRTARRDISKNLIDQLARLRHAVDRDELVVPDLYFFVPAFDVQSVQKVACFPIIRISQQHPDIFRHLILNYLH